MRWSAEEMLPLEAREVAALADGVLDGDPGVIVTGVAIDSRVVRPGDLFVALRGEHADGHDFVAGALARGAVAALVRDDAAVDGSTLVRVASPETALVSLAAGVRVRLRARVIAITGSSGKTTTKELTAAVARTTFRTVASEASFNNEIGVPLTILAAEEDTDVIVAEVGSRGIGHIAALAPIVRPDVSVVVNVGLAHVGMFGSAEAIGTAKGELVEALGPGGIAVLNADDPVVAAMSSRTTARTTTFGLSAGADVSARDVRIDGEGRASFTLASADASAAVHLRIPGEHLVSDALAAAAAGLAIGVDIPSAAAALSEAEGASWRMEVRDTAGGFRVLNDAYNANPQSTAAALKTLVAMGRDRRTWAVLGPMAELGDATDEAHDSIGRLIVRLGVARLVAVGEGSRVLYEAARREGMTPDEATLVSDVDAATALLRGALERGDVVLVKASRASGLERVAAAIAGGTDA